MKRVIVASLAGLFLALGTVGVAQAGSPPPKSPPKFVYFGWATDDQRKSLPDCTDNKIRNALCVRDGQLGFYM